MDKMTGWLFAIIVLVVSIVFLSSFSGKSFNSLNDCTEPAKLVKSQCDLKISEHKFLANTKEGKGDEEVKYYCCKPKEGKEDEFNIWIQKQEVLGGEDGSGVIKGSSIVSFEVNDELIDIGEMVKVNISEDVSFDIVKEMKDGNWCELTIYKANMKAKGIRKSDNFILRLVEKPCPAGTNFTFKHQFELHDQEAKLEENKGLYIVEMLVADTAEDREVGFWRIHVQAEKPKVDEEAKVDEVVVNSEESKEEPQITPEETSTQTTEEILA